MRPSFVFSVYRHDFMRVQQVIQCVCSVPHLVLSPHSVFHRGKQKRVNVYEFCGDKAGTTSAIKVEPFSPKKSDTPHLIASMHRRHVFTKSNSTLSTP